MSKYLDLFVSEAQEHVQAALREVAGLASGQPAPERVNALFRHFHSIKGMASSMGFAPIASLSHAVEDLFDALRKQDGPRPAGLTDVLTEALDVTSSMVAQAAQGRSGSSQRIDPDPLIARIRSLVSVAAQRPRSGSPAAQPECAGPVGPGPTPQAASLTSEPVEAAAGPATVRVPTATLDLFLNAIAELITGRGSLVEALKRQDMSAARVALSRLSGAIDHLREQVMLVRLLPFEHIMPRLTRTIRELCRRTGKRVTLEVTGADITLDRSVLEEILDPLDHIIRNAVDHGIASPSEREAAGKPAEGSLRIGLSRRGDRVQLAVEDDGVGMDPDKIRRAAVAGGFASQTDLDAMDEESLLMLATVPGFSTAPAVTDISGRGVGLDVVRTRVESLHGHMGIRSTRGRGTRIELSLPVSVAVIDAFLVDCNGAGIFAVPASGVEGVTLVDPWRVQRTISGGFLAPERTQQQADADSFLPLLDLRDLAGTMRTSDAYAGGKADGELVQVLAYHVDGRRGALAVGRVLDRRELVVKPLGTPLDRLRRYSGAALLDDGQLALILDLANLPAR